jgi:hypothetical protein
MLTHDLPSAVLSSSNFQVGSKVLVGILVCSMVLEDSMVLGMDCYSKDHDPSSSSQLEQMR